MGLESFQWLLYGGIAVMILAGLFFCVQLLFFLLKKGRLDRKMDEEYGRPQMYNRRES